MDRREFTKLGLASTGLAMYGRGARRRQARGGVHKA